MKLGVPTLVNFDGLLALIESAERGSLVPDSYLIALNGIPDEKTLWHILNAPWGSKVALYQMPRNVGVAAAWNMLLTRYPDEPLIISNDDVILGRRTFEEMALALEAHDFVASGWALFGTSPACVSKVGLYDENFWPAYYEDSDYRRRMKLADIEPFWDCSEPVQHAGCWTSFNALGQPEWMTAAIEKNMRYFIQKWGGPPDAEVFREPFDGKPPEGWHLRRPR